MSDSSRRFELLLAFLVVALLILLWQPWTRNEAGDNSVRTVDVPSPTALLSQAPRENIGQPFGSRSPHSGPQPAKGLQSGNEAATRFESDEEKLQVRFRLVTYAQRLSGGYYERARAAIGDEYWTTRIGRQETALKTLALRFPAA